MQLTAAVDRRSPTSARQKVRDRTTRYVGRHDAAIGRRRRGPRRPQVVDHVAAAAARRQRRGRVAAAADDDSSDRRRGTRHDVVFDGGTRRQVSAGAGRLTFTKHISHIGVQLPQRPDSLVLSGVRQQTCDETVRKQKRFDEREIAPAGGRQLGHTSVQ